METQERIEFRGLPLAVYREIAAHLRQVPGIEVSLISQSSPKFNYNDSQIGGLCISGRCDSSPDSQEMVQEILAYYSDHYGIPFPCTIIS